MDDRSGKWMIPFGSYRDLGVASRRSGKRSVAQWAVVGPNPHEFRASGSDSFWSRLSSKIRQGLQTQEISPVSRRQRHAIILASAPNLLHKEVTKCDLQL
jgi:hypothetical protein